jgi:tetratricopeptide (TPR) repeat protein
LANTGLGTVLTDQDQYPKALEYFKESNNLYESMGNGHDATYSKYNIASTLAKLGSLQEAKDTLAGAEKALADLKISPPGLDVRFVLLKADLALAEGRFTDAIEITKSITVSNDPELAVDLDCTRALSQALSKSQNAVAVRTAQKAVELAVQGKDPKMVNRSKLILAQVYLQNGNLKEALTSALEAKDYFVTTGQKESAWRAWLVAAKSVDEKESDTAGQYLSSASKTLADLKTDWGESYFQTYSARADIKFYIAQTEN